MPTYTIKCSVTLHGAIMTVDAKSEAEAASKAARNEWEDIIYDTAELVDWECQDEPRKG